VTNALEFIKQAEASGKPFYVNLWPDDVHSPFFPPKALRSDGSKRELYLGVVRAMDEQFAPLFDYLRDRPNLRTNTVLVIASDNGPEPGAGRAGQFRGHKGILYEGGLREPFIVWAPGFMPVSACGTVNKQSVVSAVDLLPSLAALAGVTLPQDYKPDGEDLSDTLVGKSEQTRTLPLFWTRPPDRPGSNAEPWPDLAIRQGNWKLLIQHNGESPELYDLKQDPGETQNRAADHPEKVRELKQQLLDWSHPLPLQFEVKDTDSSQAANLPSS
jgi:uncharacterized sulfatase